MRMYQELAGCTCFYRCDPSKNIKCTKQFCYLNGGSCYYTMQERYKRDGSRPLIFSEDEEESYGKK